MLTSTTSQRESRRALNQGQLEVLDLLFKFRFGTTELIAKIDGKKNGTAIRSRLGILYERGFVGRAYEGTDRLQGKYAAYYLLPEGLRELNKHKLRSDTHDKVIKSLYKNKNVSKPFIDHCLAIFAVSAQLKVLHGEALKIFTKTELVSYEYFPQPLPDGFVSVKDGGETQRYFLEIIDANTPSFALNRRLKEYAEYYDSEEWDITESEFPTVLFVCPSVGQESKLQKRIMSLGAELTMYSTTISALTAATPRNNAVWSDEPESTQKISLGALNRTP